MISFNTLNSRVAVFEESLAIPFKRIALTSGISWQYTHSKLVGTFSQFLQFQHSYSEELSKLRHVSILFSYGTCSKYSLTVKLKCSKNGNIFFYIFRWHKTLQNNQNNKLFSKTSILTNRASDVNFFPKSCILPLKLIITCQSKDKTTN